MKRALLLLLPFALGRTLSFAAEATSPMDRKSADDTIRLSDFTVTAEEDRGYAASETLSGSRVATKIIDLPYTVNVLTSEFFADFAIFDLNDSLTQIGSFTGLSGGGGFTLRGFSSSSQLRDGFYRIGRFGTSNVDRIEVIKGSNAAIYGRTSPGGMINMISKEPRSQPGAKFTVNAGSYSTLRGVFEVTGPVLTTSLGKTSFLFTASESNRAYDQEYARTRNHEGYLAVRQRFNDGGTLLVSAEYFLQTIHSPTGAAPLVIDQNGTSTANDDVAIGYAFNLANYNPYGPHSESTRGNPSFTAIYDRKLSSIWSVRLGANYYRARSWKANDNTGFGSININPASATTPITSTRGNPVKQIYSEDGGCFQADFLAHTWLFNKKVESRTLLTLDLNDYYRWDPNWTYGTVANDPTIAAWNATGSGRVVTLTRDFVPTAPLTYFPNDWMWGHEVPGQTRKGRISVLGGLLRQQAGFFNSRLLTFAGARFDAVRFRHRDFLTAETTFRAFPEYANYHKGDQIRRVETAMKPNVGINYRLVSNFRVFANYSQSYFVNQGDGPALIAEANYAPEEAAGYDYGFKGALLDERLTFTVSGFYATRENVGVTEVIESPTGNGYTTATRRDGNQLVRGFEIDLNWRLGRTVSLNGSWGHVYSIYTDFGSAFPLSVGRRVNNVSPENGSLSVRYTPRDGWLRGFSGNVGVTWVARTPTEAPNAGDTYTTTATGARVLSRSTRQWALTVPGFHLWNAAIRYTTRANARTNQQIGVNVNNVLDRDYLRVSKQKGDRRAVYVTYSFGLGSLRN